MTFPGLEITLKISLIQYIQGLQDHENHGNINKSENFIFIKITNSILYIRYSSLL